MMQVYEVDDLHLHSKCHSSTGVSQTFCQKSALLLLLFSLFDRDHSDIFYFFVFNTYYDPQIYYNFAFHLSMNLL